MTSPIDSCVDSKMSENSRFDIAVPKGMGEKDGVDEIEIRAETGGNDAKQDHSRNLVENDLSLDKTPHL